MRDILGRDGRADALTAALVAAALALAGGAGCGGGNAAPPPTGDAGAEAEPDADDGFDDAAPDWAAPICPAPSGDVQNGACNDVAADSPCVDQIQVDDNAPGPEGGAVVAGTYDLVDRISYTSPGGATGPSGQPTQETFVLTGADASFTLAAAVLAAGTTTRTSSAISVTAAQLRLTVTPTCPAPADADGGAGAPTAYYYTAMDATLILYRIAATGPVQASTYRRR